MSDDRQTMLKLLLTCPENLEDLVNSLRQYSWDCDVTLVSLTCEDLRSVLKKFLDGAINASRLEQWSQALEMRDDVGFAPGSEELIKQILFQLANPEINGEITPIVVNKIFDLLGNYCNKGKEQ